MSHKGLYRMSSWFVISNGVFVSSNGEDSVEEVAKCFEKRRWRFDETDWAEEFKLPIEFLFNTDEEL